MGILVGFASMIGLGLLVGTLYQYSRTVFDAAIELTADQKAACARIVDAGLGRPWVCRAAIEAGYCECFPCHNLKKEMRGELALTRYLR